MSYEKDLFLVKCLYRNLSGNLRFLRNINRLSQENVSQLVNVSRRHYGECEKGEAIPDLVTICALADIYSIRLDCLIAEDLTRKSLTYLEENFGIKQL